MRRAVALAFRPAVAAAATRTAVSSTVRDDLSRVATKVKEEANGHALDLADMADATRVSLKAVQDAIGRHPDGGGDAKVKGKLNTLTASLKAYQNRLKNLQTEAKSLHRDSESLVKHLWGTETLSNDAAAEGEAAAAKAAAGSGNAFGAGEDFGADAPHLAQMLQEKPSGSSATTVEAERVAPGASSSSADKSAKNDGDVEVEVLEVEVESPEEDVPITTITQELYEKGIDFADCHDAAALRRRYKEMKDGKFEKQAPPQQQQNQYRPAPPAPERATYQQQQQYGGYDQNSSTNETGLAHDPHPGAQRKMIDPMKFVWEVKIDVARENGVDANTIDLWSGATKLEDHKRLYDYGPTLNANPIQIRQKGDVPSYQKF